MLRKARSEEGERSQTSPALARCPTLKPHVVTIWNKAMIADVLQNKVAWRKQEEAWRGTHGIKVNRFAVFVGHPPCTA